MGLVDTWGEAHRLHGHPGGAMGPRGHLGGAHRPRCHPGEDQQVGVRRTAGLAVSRAAGEAAGALRCGDTNPWASAVVEGSWLGGCERWERWGRAGPRAGLPAAALWQLLCRAACAAETKTWALS